MRNTCQKILKKRSLSKLAMTIDIYIKFHVPDRAKSSSDIYGEDYSSELPVEAFATRLLKAVRAWIVERPNINSN